MQSFITGYISLKYPAGKKDVKEYTIPDDITIIELYAFSGCNNLENINISNNVTEIENYAFKGCTSFTKIEIPANVQEIGTEAFGECRGVSQVVFEGALEQIPEEDRDAASVRWLARRVDSLGKFAVGAEAYDFELVNPEGKSVRLSDFRGKYVLVDFWASWCGPCRQEMKRLLPIYEELKGEDLEFVSVSLDKREQDWRKMLDAERLPWVMLWDKEGFSVGDEPNAIQRAYGFYSIPFIVLIDKEGRIAGRELRGEQVKEAILKARQGN